MSDDNFLVCTWFPYCGKQVTPTGSSNFPYKCPTHGDIEGKYVTHISNIIPKNTFKGSQRNPWFNKVLQKLAETHDKKNHDYCPDDNNPFFNFEFSAAYANMSPTGKRPLTAHDSFNILKGTKIARLVALVQRGEAANNEPFTDSEWDDVVYFLLHEAYKLKCGEDRLKQAEKEYKQ